MPRALKVFRSPIGFHDAYVAAPSRKAALAAWGSDADLFARGVAEEVTDPALTAAPLARPGEVIRVPRGTAEDHLAALPPTPTPKPTGTAAAKRPVAPPPKRPPKPSRAALDDAEAAIEGATKDHEARLRALADHEAALARERRAADRDHREAVERLERTRDDARAAYDRAMDRWRR